MPEVTVSVPDGKTPFLVAISDDDVNDVIAALCEGGGRQSQIVDAEGNTIDNPETVAQFANRMVREWIASQTKTYRQTKAAASPLIVDPYADAEE